MANQLFMEADTIRPRLRAEMAAAQADDRIQAHVTLRHDAEITRAEFLNRYGHILADAPVQDGPSYLILSAWLTAGQIEALSHASEVYAITTPDDYATTVEEGAATPQLDVYRVPAPDAYAVPG